MMMIMMMMNTACCHHIVIISVNSLFVSARTCVLSNRQNFTYLPA